VKIIGGDFAPAAPAACAVKEQAAGIRNLGAVHIDLVVMEANGSHRVRKRFRENSLRANAPSRGALWARLCK